jgi:peptidyl-prolyl cis-trans isomerase SurA
VAGLEWPIVTRMNKALLLGMAILLAIPAASQTVVEEIVARVNDSIITRSDLTRSREQLQQEYQQQYGAQAATHFAAKEKDILRDLIDQKLLVTRAKDAGINVENELVKRLDEMRKQMNLETMEDLEKAAAAQGVSFEDYKEGMKNSMMTQQVIGQEVGRKIQILPSEVQKYYDEHKDELKREETVRLSEILISTDAPAPKAGEQGPADSPEAEAARVAAAEAKAKSVMEEIRKGAKFEDVAKQHSSGPTAAEGGELGEFKRGTLADELERKVFAMKPGEVSDVIRTKQGFIILKVTAHTPEGIPTLKEVENRIQEALYYEKLQPALRQFLTKLREESYVDVKKGFVDSGASPNQTAPVTVAANDEKKEEGKKRKKKLGIF